MARLPRRIEAWVQKIKKDRRWEKQAKQKQTQMSLNKRMQKHERQIKKDLYGPATAIIQNYKLHQSPRSKNVLAAELQKTFLESLRRDKGKLTRREKKCLDLVTRVQVIQLALCEHQRKKTIIPIEEALLINRIAMGLMKRAEKTDKGNMEQKKRFQRIGAEAKEKVKALLLKARRNEKNRYDLAMQENLWIVTEIGASLIESTAGTLPEFTQAGFTAVDQTVEIAFGGKMQ